MSNPVHVDNIYYNVELSNNTSSGAPLDVVFNSEQNEIVVQHPDEFYLTVARFSISGLSIPNAYFEAIPNQSNPNLGIYTVTLTYVPDNANFTQNVTFVPQNNHPTPIPPFNKINPYYFVYSYQNLLNLFNSALQQAFNGLKAAYPGLILNEAPYFVYRDGTFILVMEASYLDEPVKLYLNAPSFAIFPSLSGKTNGYNLTNEALFFEFTPYFADNFYQIDPSNPVSPPVYIKFPLESKPFSTLSALKKIIITSNMPVNGELKPSLISLDTTQAGNVSFQNILTDFVPNSGEPGLEREQLVYNPTIYRLIDLKSTAPLNLINLRVFWVDRNDNLYPLRLIFGQSASIKLLFVKKEVYEGINDLQKINRVNGKY